MSILQSKVTSMSGKIFFATVRGILVAQGIVELFMLLMLFLILAGTPYGGETAQIRETLAFWPPIGLFALPVGICMGIGSVLVKRYRIIIMLAGALIGYQIVSLATVFWITPVVKVENIWMIIFLGGLISVVYGFFNVPLLVLGVILLEKWNRSL